MKYCLECDEQTNRTYSVSVLHMGYGEPLIVELPLCDNCAENSENYSVCSECGNTYSVQELDGIDGSDAETCPHCLLKDWLNKKKKLEQDLMNVEINLRTFFHR